MRIVSKCFQQVRSYTTRKSNILTGESNIRFICCTKEQREQCSKLLPWNKLPRAYRHTLIYRCSLLTLLKDKWESLDDCCALGMESLVHTVRETSVTSWEVWKMKFEPFIPLIRGFIISGMFFSVCSAVMPSLSVLWRVVLKIWSLVL